MGLEGTITLKVIAAMEFGKQIMIEYAVENVMAGRSVAQIKQISNKLIKVQYLLTSGSLYAALDELQNMEPDEFITQATKNKYVLKLRQYLGV